MSEAGSVSLNIANNVATVTFSHPKSNSLPGALLDELSQAIDDANRDKSSAVILLQSEGEKAFCAGASFDELCAISSPIQGKEFFLGFAKVILSMRNAEKFIVGRVQGKAVGGGVGVVAACDYVVAHKSASVRLSELALGIGPFVIGPVVQRRIGRTNYMQMSMDTEWYDAHWAQTAGLYAHVVDDHATLDDKVTTLVTKLANSNPEAMLALRQIFWKGTDHWGSLLTARAETSGQLVISDYTQSAIEAFKSKN